MKATSRKAGAPIPWGIYHQDREFAREVGDPCLGVVKARSKGQAEAKARRLGFGGPTGIWGHPLGG